MRRMMLLVTAAMMMLVTALSGAALAQPVNDEADRQCMQLARQTFGFGPNFNPGNTNFVGGTEGRDYFSGQGTEGRDVFCGFGDVDFIQTLDEGDIFLGGEGNDPVSVNYGTFYGGEGDDWLDRNYGTFYGGEGQDVVFYNDPGATFYGVETFPDQ